MTRKRVDELLAQGACLTVFPDEPPAITTLLGAAQHHKAPKRLRWCPAFPEHQGNVHDLPYTRLKLEAGGRDVAFMRDDEMVAYLCPIIESSGDTEAMLETWGRWQYILQRHRNRADLEEFMTDAIGGP